MNAIAAKGAALALSLLAFTAPAFAAASITPFGQETIDLTAQDVDLLKAAIREVLEKNSVGATASWRDESSGRAGRATLLKVFEKAGRQCGTVKHDFTQGGGQDYVLPLCKFADGSWKIVF